MNNGKGNFEMMDSLEQAEQAAKEQKRKDQESGIFREGEKIMLRGSWFKINSIHSNGKMILKLLKRP